MNNLRNDAKNIFVNFRTKVNITLIMVFCQLSFHFWHTFLHFLTDFQALFWLLCQSFLFFLENTIYFLYNDRTLTEKSVLRNL